MSEVWKAYKRIMTVCVDVIGNDIKDDLILVGTAIVPVETLQSECPELYEREEAEDIQNETLESQEESDENLDPSEDLNNPFDQQETN